LLQLGHIPAGLGQFGWHESAEPEAANQFLTLGNALGHRAVAAPAAWSSPKGRGHEMPSPHSTIARARVSAGAIQLP